MLAACAAHGPVLPSHLPGGGEPVELAQTPFFPQTDYQCGPASLATVLAASGRDVDPESLVGEVYLPGRRGSLQIEMTAAARRHGRLPYRIDSTLDALLAELRAGRPVLVFQNLGVRLLPVWHYAVVIGYRPGEDTIVLRSGEERRLVMPAADFLKTWERADRWGMVLLEPGSMPVRPDPGRYLSAAAAMGAVNPPGVSIRLMRAAVAQWPGNALARFALGNALYDEGEPRKAITAYRSALGLDPVMPAARNNLAHVLREQGCHDLALAQIEQALADAPEDDGMRRTLLQTRSEIQSEEADGVDECPEEIWRAQEDSNL